MKKLIPAILLLAGCAHDPVVDMRGVDARQYRQDLAECRTYANQVSTAEAAAKRGAIGAAVGGTIGAIIGDHHTAKRGAGIGGVSGSVKGAEKAEARKTRILYNCLRGRGYNVLG